MKILVYNWHEPYICMFAATGHDFDVAPPLQVASRVPDGYDQDMLDRREYPGFRWHTGFRPLPANVTEVTFEESEDKIAAGAYDMILCTALPDVPAVQKYSVPRLFVMYNMVGTDSQNEGMVKADYVTSLQPFFRSMDLAHISEKKRLDWGWTAPVVKSGIDPDDYGPFDGSLPRVLRVGNSLRRRNHMLGYSIQEEILGGDIPSTILGLNPDIPSSRPSTDWEDLKEHYRHHRVMLSTLTNEHEDGYNCAVLEAMASGMPIVSLANSSTPIIDGVNGYVSDDLGYLRQRLLELLEDRELAVELGARARQTIVDDFHISDFVAGWNRVFDDCVAGRLENVV